MRRKEKINEVQLLQLWYGKLLRVCKLLLIIHQKLQLYGKTSQQTQEKEEMEIGRRIPKSIWRIEGQNHKSTSTYSSEEERKIQGKNRYFKTCDWKSSITRTRREIETHCFSIKNSATS